MLYAIAMGQIKIRRNQILILCPSLRISGQLPAPIINGGGDSFWNYKFSRARDLDLGLGHTAYHRASLIDLYIHSKFHWNQRNILWTNGRTDGRTYIWTDRHLRPTLIGRLRRVDRPNEWIISLMVRSAMSIATVAMPVVSPMLTSERMDVPPSTAALCCQNHTTVKPVPFNMLNHATAYKSSGHEERTRMTDWSHQQTYSSPEPGTFRLRGMNIHEEASRPALGCQPACRETTSHWSASLDSADSPTSDKCWHGHHRQMSYFILSTKNDVNVITISCII